MPPTKTIVNFYTQSPSLPIKNLKKLRLCIRDLIHKEKEISYSSDINVVFCNDDYLVNINSKYLQHDDFTDVITFNYSEKNKLIGEIYISSERVRENAKKYSQKFSIEILRVIIHGILHLCGYEDRKPDEKIVMTEKEDLYILEFRKKIENI